MQPMTQSQLIQHISAFDTPIKGIKSGYESGNQDFTLSELVDLTFYHDQQIALKASRLLETMLVKFPESYCDEIEYLVQRVENIDCLSCKKHFARIIEHITSPEVSKEVRYKVKQINFERVIELCFAWMCDTHMLVSIRANAAEALFNLRHRYPWIAEDLSRKLENMLPGAAPLLAAKGDMILSYLHCED
jgi:hypothetical protein